MPLAQGAGGQPQVGPAAAAAAALVVVLAAPDGSATASVYLHGATLASWSVGGRELLFVSPRAAFSPPKAIRGGVPVCFPQFGMLGPLTAQHGFARNMEWTVADEGSSSCTLQLESSDATLALWPHPFRLEMAVSLLDSGALKQELRVLNTGSAPLEFTAALHTYFNVTDISSASVVGLKGLQYTNNTTGSVHTDEAGAVVFTGEVDRAYTQAPALLKIHDSAANSVVLVHKQGFPDAVVWNPAEAKAAAMADLGADSFRRFVCVEVAQARSGAVALQPGQQWSGRQTLEYDTLGES